MAAEALILLAERARQSHTQCMRLEICDIGLHVCYVGKIEIIGGASAATVRSSKLKFAIYNTYYMSQSGIW